MQEKYIAFYSPTPFWAGNRPDFEAMQQDSTQFRKAMEEEVFASSTNDYTLRVYKDGLFVVRIEQVEKELDNLESKYKAAIGDNALEKMDDKIQLMGKYFDYFNTLLLLFDSIMLKKHKFDIGNTELRIGDAFRVTLQEGRIGGGGPAEATNRLGVRYLSTYSSNHPVHLDPRITSRFINIPITAFNELLVDFEQVQNDYHKVKILSQIMSAVSRKFCTIRAEIT
jgi:hypothetical protein